MWVHGLSTVRKRAEVATLSRATGAGGARGPRGGIRPHGVTRTGTRIGRATLGNSKREEQNTSTRRDTPILRRFTMKPILFALPRTNKFGLEN